MFTLSSVNDVFLVGYPTATQFRSRDRTIMSKFDQNTEKIPPFGKIVPSPSGTARRVWSDRPRPTWQRWAEKGNKCQFYTLLGFKWAGACLLCCVIFCLGRLWGDEWRFYRGDLRPMFFIPIRDNKDSYFLARQQRSKGGIHHTPVLHLNSSLCVCVCVDLLYLQIQTPLQRWWLRDTWCII